MATFVEGGDALFTSLAYAPPDPYSQQFVAAQMDAPTSNLNEMGRRFYSDVKDVYNRISGSHAMRIARAASRKVASLWGMDEVRSLQTTGELQHAPLKMQRWIMAQPKVRGWFYQQRLEGYESSYVDVHEGDVGEEHYDYRRVMNGVVVENDDGWSATTYYDELIEGDIELSFEEQNDILNTWEWVASYLKPGNEDPTSKWNSEL